MPDTPKTQCENAKEEPVKKEFWIKFKLVHEGDKKPLEDIVLDLKLPDDSITMVETNEKGELEIKNIDDGTCHLNIDWKELIDLGITIDQMAIIKL